MVPFDLIDFYKIFWLMQLQGIIKIMDLSVGELHVISNYVLVDLESKNLLSEFRDVSFDYITFWK